MYGTLSLAEGSPRANPAPKARRTGTTALKLVPMVDLSVESMNSFNTTGAREAGIYISELTQSRGFEVSRLHHLEVASGFNSSRCLDNRFSNLNSGPSGRAQ